jgi:hypothetical protein
MRRVRIPLIIFIIFSILSCAKSGTYIISIQYKSLKPFSSLQEKIGSRLAVLPVKDERTNPLYIGRYLPLQGISSYFKSDPFPLDIALTQSLSNLLSQHKIQVVPISFWDGKPESLKGMDTDSVLMIEIKKFWIEGKASAFRTEFKSQVHFVFHLGVKKESKVFRRNIEVEKEESDWRFRPEKVEEMVNDLLGEIFNSFFSNPY